MTSRRDPVSVATSLVERRYPKVSAAVLAGSVVAGRSTPTSDLDVVVIVESEDLPWRESFLEQGWPVEVFVHSTRSMGEFFDKDVRERRPSMLRMWSEGRLVVDSEGIGTELKERAAVLLAEGYPEPTGRELRTLRYQATDILEDLEGDPSGPESTFVVPTLAFALCHLKLLHAGAWIGTGKWMLREAQRLDPGWADELVHAMRAHWGGDVRPLVELADRTLDEFGGRLFDGFSDGWQR